MLLLDTCTLLMLAGQQEALSQKALSLLENNPDELLVSAISAFEIVLKHKIGKLILPLSPETWYQTAIERYNIEEIVITSTIAMHSSSLPFIHRDPCDRIIIATALECKCKILTMDTVIPQYPGVKAIW